MDVVFHLAALIAIPYSYQAPQSFVETNVTGTLSVLEAARRNDVAKVVLTSTSEVYGTPETVPIVASHPLRAQSPYAATKVAADQLGMAYAASYGLDVAILRPFNTYGPRQSARAVIPTIITQILSGKSSIHLGEEGPPDYVWQALDILQVDRIDHGNRALEDSALVRRLAELKMPLTVCPLSNLKLCVVRDMAQHPLKKMLEAGLVATVNSDDPAYFGGYVGENFQSVASALELSPAEIADLARNSFRASFLSEAEKAKHLAEIDAYCAAYFD
jgi:hypothetical protein